MKLPAGALFLRPTLAAALASTRGPLQLRPGLTAALVALAVIGSQTGD